MKWLDQRWMEIVPGNTSAPLEQGAGVFLTAWQWRRMVDNGSVFNAPVAVTVPDFLRYARILGTGRAAEMLQLPGLHRAAMAGSATGIKSLGLLPRLARTDFWALAETLIRYDLALLGKAYKGPVLLHPNLTDMALFFDQASFLDMFAKLGGRRGAYGFHTNQLQKLLNLLACTGLRPIMVSYLSSPDAAEADQSLIKYVVGRHSNLKDTRWIMEADSWPVGISAGFIDNWNGEILLHSAGVSSQHPQWSQNMVNKLTNS